MKHIRLGQVEAFKSDTHFSSRRREHTTAGIAYRCGFVCVFSCTIDRHEHIHVYVTVMSNVYCPENTALMCKLITFTFIDNGTRRT